MKKMNPPKKQNNKHPLKHPDQRVGVFIDVQNLYYSAKHLYGKKVNFGNIVAHALAGRKLIRAIAYVVRTESQDEQPFFEALYNLGIETREKDLQIFTAIIFHFVYLKSRNRAVFSSFLKNFQEMKL